MSFQPFVGASPVGSYRFNLWLLRFWLVLFAMCLPALAQTSSVTLAWNPSTGMSIAGYRLYQGVASGTYTNALDVGNVTNATVGGLISGVKYYFAVTAYDTSGLESIYSSEVTYTPGTSVAPTIALTSPTTGNSFTAPATVSLSASVTANGHTITKVQFYNGSSLIAEVSTAPYNYTWSGVSAGSYTLKATAVYDSGSSVTSAPVTISVAAPTTPPSIVLTSPANNSAFSAPASFSLAASVNANGHTINKVQFYNGQALLGEVIASPYIYAVNNLNAGSYVLSATAVYDQGSTVTSAGVNVTVTNSPAGNPTALPAPWRTADIGSPGVVGSASTSGGVYQLSGAGTLGTVSDQFRFLYQPMTGKGEIIARIQSELNTGAGAFAGLMMRETLAAGSEYVFVGLAPDGTLISRSRTLTSATATQVSSGSGSLPNVWVRLVRSGATFYAYTSSDGATWRMVDSKKFNMSSGIYFGFAVGSGSSTVLNTSSFGNATIVP